MHESTEARWLRRLLSAIVVLLAVIAVELSVMMPPIQGRSEAQVLPDAVRQRAETPILPDSARQRADLIAEQAKANATLERILDQLRTGTVKVKVASTDKDLERAPTLKNKAEAR